MIHSLFYLFAGISLLSAIGVVLSNKPVQAVLSLILAFIGAAGVWLLLEAEFLALILVVVYVGAVMVLFLFVVMMLDLRVEKGAKVAYWPLIVLLVAGILLMLSCAFLNETNFNFPSGGPLQLTGSNLAQLGLLLYSAYLYPFEIVGVILLVAMVAAIALAYRGRRLGSKVQDPAQQIAVRAEDRLKIVSAETWKQPGVSS